MKIIALSGSNFEFGKKLGKKFSKAIAYRLKCLNITDELYFANKDTLDTLYNNCMEKFPDLMEEIKGISEGSGCEIKSIFCLNLLELPDINRCSTIISRDKDIIIAHNEDGHPFENKRDFSIVKRKYDDLVVHSFNYPGELPGSSFEWNSAGLIVSVNNLGLRKVNLNGIPRTFIARKAIEKKTLDEAIDVIKNNECASGFHYTIGQNERVVSVEQHHNKVSVIEVDQEYYHTNHYLHNYFKSELVVSDNSVVRHERISKLFSQKKDILTILFDKKNKPNSIYGKKDNESQTMATFFAYPLQNKVRVYPNDNRRRFLEFKIN